jgi:carbon-monoxide dehydrogenase large subunit
MPDNIAAAKTLGDAEVVEQAFAQAAHVTRLELVNPRLVGNPIEPRTSICDYDPESGRRTLHAGHQSAGRLKGGLAHVLQADPEDFHIIIQDVGGGFGTKTPLYPEDATLVYAAGKLKRPIKWRSTRSDEFQATLHARNQESVAELACDANGKILALRAETLANVGAYLLNPGMFIPLFLTTTVISSMYHIPALHLSTKCVLTNTAPLGAFRGAGRPEGVYLTERLVNQAARELGIDPIEFRKRNMITPEQMPYTTPVGESLDSGKFAEVLDRVLEQADWQGFENRKATSQQSGKLRGRGLGCYIEWTGSELNETVTLQAEGSGALTLFSGTQAMGQGIATSYLQILSEQLGLPAEQLAIVQGDTDRTEGHGSVGSRSLFVGGTAMLSGIEDFLKEGRRLAAEELEAATEDVEYEEGRFTVKGTHVGIGLFELARRQAGGKFATKTKKELAGRHRQRTRAGGAGAHGV